MPKQRYQIVRVNCKNCEFKTRCLKLQKCIVGDTKEQLAAKIETALRITGQKVSGHFNFYPWTVRKAAQEIVEYLGVKE